MNRIPLYHALRSGQQAGDCLFATVLDGSAAGTQILFSGGEPVWLEGTLPEKADLCALQSCTSTGFLELGCGRVFAERFGAAPQLVVCGGGHVAAAVVRLAKLLCLPVTAVEDRPEFAAQLREAGADTVLCAPFEEALQQVPGGAETYFAVLTRAHAFDLVCLKQILQKPAAYVGMLGSHRRAMLVRQQLTQAGADSARIETLHAPIGLSIGAQTAQEIALSILAQIVEVKNARTQTEGFVPAILEAMEKAERMGQQTVLATIVSRHGSTPRDVGAKMLVFSDGKTAGSVGGGIMEYQTTLAAQEMLAKGRQQRVLRCTTEGNGEDTAVAACGGSMDLLLQIVTTGEEPL